MRLNKQLLSLLSLASRNNRQTYKATKTLHPPAIDGVIEYAEWSGASWTSDFIDITGENSTNTPRFRTRVKMQYDDEYLYIAAQMEEPHVKVY
jgi:Carbohydrate family 9 binding domain-like